MADYQKCKQLAEELLKKYGVTEPVINIFDIAKAEGLDLKFVYMPEQLKNVAGFLDRDKKIIYINEQDPPNKQTFTIAHELGHYMLGHTPDQYKVLLRIVLQSQEYDPIEQEANCFAANILVPQKMLQDIIDQYNLTNKNADILAKFFGVSKQAMEYRLKDLKYASTG